jgi:hypothetical protein
MLDFKYNLPAADGTSIQLSPDSESLILFQILDSSKNSMAKFKLDANNAQFLNRIMMNLIPALQTANAQDTALATKPIKTTDTAAVAEPK